VLQIHTDVTDNTILGDKSGPHLYYVPTLMEWFPDAKVVHTFRDPRAVLASRLLLDRRVRAKRKGGRLRPIWLRLTEPLLSLMTVLYVTIAWLHAARLHYKYNKRYPKNYYLSRFEDLISEPEKSVRKLCEFLEIEFDSTMLSPPKIGSSYRPDGDTGFDQQTLTRWRSRLKPWMNAWLLLWGKKYLREFGYIH
jgi:hypothetical protein